MVKNLYNIWKNFHICISTFHKRFFPHHSTSLLNSWPSKHCMYVCCSNKNESWSKCKIKHLQGNKPLPLANELFEDCFFFFLNLQLTCLKKTIHLEPAFKGNNKSNSKKLKHALRGSYTLHALTLESFGRRSGQACAGGTEATGYGLVSHRH